MTAEARILIQNLGEALQIPIEAVVERHDRFYCALPLADGAVETREIKVGSVNDTNLVVESGLVEGDEVILNVGDEEVIALMALPE